MGLLLLLLLLITALLGSVVAEDGLSSPSTPRGPADAEPGPGSSRANAPRGPADADPGAAEPGPGRWVFRDQGQAPIRDLDAPTGRYRTPRSGEGLRTRVAGRDVEVPSRDRSRVAAWELGSVLGPPGIGEADFTPVAATYFWSHPDEDRLFRAVLIGVFNEVFWARSPAGWGELEVDLTWENFNVPVAQPEVIDGETLDAESVERGYLRPGLGIGWRRQIDPGYNDNMLLVRLAAEPSYVYFDDDPAETAGDFRVPQDGMELRAHLQVRLDAVERNLLELPHSGFLLGGDVIYGYRPSQEDWGPGGRRNAGDGRNWVSATAYLLGAGPVPFVQSERHRLVGSLHAGVGAGLDRFSAPRLGGGPDARGEEWDSTARVIVPGAAIDEFFPRHYAVLAAEYRFEPIFFTYVGVRGALAWLDRDRRRGSRLRSSDSLLPSIGARITTGFFFETRLRIDYDYNFGVVRHGEFGGHGVVVEVAGEF